MSLSNFTMSCLPRGRRSGVRGQFVVGAGVKRYAKTAAARLVRHTPIVVEVESESVVDLGTHVVCTHQGHAVAAVDCRPEVFIGGDKVVDSDVPVGHTVVDAHNLAKFEATLRRAPFLHRELSEFATGELKNMLVRVQS